MTDRPVSRLSEHPIHLGLGAVSVVQPLFTGEMDWYGGYGERHGADGIEGRLVSMHTFSEDWDVWEMHPSGSEVVLCTHGRVRLHQEDLDGSVTAVELDAGEYAINNPGVWHTMDLLDGPATAVFITSGEGTQHRERTA
jgi:quercetin dioxygenase-like cupin family protein